MYDPFHVTLNLPIAMNRNILTAFTALLLTAAVSLTAEVKTGDPAPAFTLTDIHGEQHSLADYKGKYVVLEWFNHGCPFVQKFYEPGKMQEWQRDMAAKDVIWLVIDSTKTSHRDHLDNAAAQQLATRWKMAPAAMLMDPTGEVGKAYGATNTPHMYVIGPEGTLIYQGAIDDKRSTDSDDIEGATNYVLKAVSEAKAGKPVAEATTKAYGCGIKYAN